MSRGRKTSIYLSDTLSEKLGCNPIVKPTKAVATLINRHYLVFIAEKENLKKIFTKEDLAVLSSLCEGVNWDPPEKIRDGVLHQVQDCSDYIFNQNNLSKTDLETKLRSLSVSQQYTLVELLERIQSKQKAS